MNRRFFKTLYGKIATTLSVLFLFLGLLYVLLSFFTTRLHIHEVDQRLYKNLAEYLVSETFFIRDGKVNEEALKESFETLMHINPNIELYVIDAAGTILSHAAPPEKVVRDTVSLEPVTKFLHDSEGPPIFGDDPRDPHRQKVFSVSPIPTDGTIEGYLYIILGSEEYDSASHMLQRSHDAPSKREA